MDCKVKVELLPAAEALTDDVCPVDWAIGNIEVAYRESCGHSVMCRDGMAQLRLLVKGITSGSGTGEDLSLVRELCQVISTTPGCALSAQAAKNVLLSMDRYPGEWEAHCMRKRCSHLVCRSYFGVYIDPALCSGCGQCLSCVPQGTIAGGDNMIHVILDETAAKTDEFLSCCPRGAIKKYGALKPRGIPEAPVPVGSETGGAAVPRRRRRI